MFGLIGSFHSTVNGTTKDLLASGWKKVRQPKPGDVLVWAERITKNGAHCHLGFFIGVRCSESADSCLGLIPRRFTAGLRRLVFLDETLRRESADSYLG